MKKLAFAALAASTLLASPAFAQATNTDTTVITANIASLCTIDLPANNNTLAPNTTTALGDTTAQCNDVDGFTATVSSANGGFLKAAQGNNGSTIPYQIDFAGTGGPRSLATPQSYPAPAYLTATTFATSIVTGAFNGPAYAGAYSDTVTINVVPN